MKLPATCAIIIATANVAQAQTITVFQSGFEPADGYTPGNLNGQNGWFAHLGQDPNFGEIVDTGALSGTQSVLLDGQDVQSGFAGVLRLTPIAPMLAGVPLRYIEVTGRCAIFDPTLVVTHHSNMYLVQNKDMSFQGGNGGFVTAVGIGSQFGQYVYGWPVNPVPTVVSVTPGVAFDFRHLVDYQTGFSAAWKDGTVAFENFTDAFDPNFITNEFWFQSVANTNNPYDTRVWYDDIHIKAIYGCQADANGDAEISVDDLVVVILGWGQCPTVPSPCPADINRDGQVDVDDLVAVILGWGSCD